MQTKSLNTNLRRASEAKNDEFYTQLSDIEKELKNYKRQFRGKIVYCNCDDPFESNFFKYFAKTNRESEGTHAINSNNSTGRKYSQMKNRKYVFPGVAKGECVAHCPVALEWCASVRCLCV